MARFRYYITNLFDGTIQGTDSAEMANDLRGLDEFFIVDTETGTFLAPDPEMDVDIQPYVIEASDSEGGEV